MNGKNVIMSRENSNETEMGNNMDSDKIKQLNDDLKSSGLQLCLEADALCLTDGKLSMKGDFSEMASRLKYNNLTHELVVKAAKIKSIDRPLNILDATAGMGEDSLLLAAAGHNVTLYEYDPVIAALLRNTLERALSDQNLGETASRMKLVEGDSIKAMQLIATQGEAPDVILLDPMFPQRQKSGLIKKKFQLLQQLESPCSNEEEMLEAALNSGAKKVIIKRPAKGPFLGGRKPDYSLDGKAVRYDCHILHP